MDVIFRRGTGEQRVIANRHLPRWRAGGVGALTLVTWVEPKHDERAHDRVQEVLDAFLAELRESPELCLVTAPHEVQAAQRRGQMPVLLGAEGLACLEPDPLATLDRLVKAGLRLGQLTWNERNFMASGWKGYPIGQGTLSDGGLTGAGREVLRAMAGAGLLLDLSHLSERSFWDVIDFYDGPVLVSHANARALMDHPRNLTDRQLKAVAERGGVVGGCAFSGFLKADGASLDDLVEHLLHMADVMGPEHLALGFDFGDYLPEPDLYTLNPGDPDPVTLGLENVLAVPALLARLRERGFSPAEVDGIAHGNFTRLWSGVNGEVLPQQ